MPAITADVKQKARVSRKAGQFTESVIREMTREALKYGAVNLSQGFPDFSCSEEMISLVNKYMKAGNNQYAPMPGYIGLREVLAQKTEELYGAKYDPETEITITAV